MPTLDINYFLEHLEDSWKCACADKNNKHMQWLAKKISRSWAGTPGDGAVSSQDPSCSEGSPGCTADRSQSHLSAGAVVINRHLTRYQVILLASGGPGHLTLKFIPDAFISVFY